MPSSSQKIRSLIISSGEPIPLQEDREVLLRFIVNSGFYDETSFDVRKEEGHSLESLVNTIDDLWEDFAIENYLDINCLIELEFVEFQE